MLRIWLDARAKDLGNGGALRPYAVLLALIHPLSAIAWFSFRQVADVASGEDCVCWPLLPGCFALRPYLSHDLVRNAVVLYAATGAAAAALFAARKARAGLLVFISASVLGALLYSLDYRLRTNQTYMFAWVCAVFLFAPGRWRALQALLVSFYVWAGTLKLNREWVSGEALYAKPALVPESLVPASCVYVLVLELVLVWCLLSTRPRLRMLVFAQLVVFHAVSWPVVGYFYPMEMWALIAIFPLIWRYAPGEALSFADVTRGGRDRRATYAVAGTFAAFQLVPYAFPGDTAITGEGRLFALHMFDAQVECRGGASLSGDSRRPAPVPLIDSTMNVRTRCDPVVLVERGRRLCREMRAAGDVRRVAVGVDAKRASDVEWSPLLHLDDFCSKDLAYSVWHHNDWIGR